MFKLAYVGNSLTYASSLELAQVSSGRAEQLSQNLLGDSPDGHLASALLHRVPRGGSHKCHVEALRAKLGRDMGPALRRVKALGLEPPDRAAVRPLRLGDARGRVRRRGGGGAGPGRRRALPSGDAFSASHSAAGDLRLTVASCTEPRVFEVLNRAMRACGRQKSDAHAG